MPARKHSALSVGHTTKAQDDQRVDDENAMTPAGDVFARVPPQLKKHTIALAVWVRLARLYGSMQAKLVNELDRDLLVDYCLLAEQVVELDALRSAIFKELKARKGTTKTIEDLVGMDARVDRKRKLMQELRQSLYLTPRSRGATTPAKKPPDAPEDEMERLLAGVKGL